MKKVVIALSLFTIAAMASANVWFDVVDRDFDYTNTETDTAYLSLTQVDGDIQVQLSETMSTDALPAIHIDVPDLNKKNFFGHTIGAELSDLSDLELIEAGHATRGFQVLHEDISLATVVDAYTEQLAALGFDAVQVERAGGHYNVSVLSNGQDNIRAVFINSSKGVTARIYSL